MVFIIIIVILILFHLITKLLLLRSIKRLRKFVEYICIKDYGDLTSNQVLYINNTLNYYDVLSTHRHYNKTLSYLAYDFVLVDMKKKLVKYLPEEQIKIRNKAINEILK